MLREHLSQEHDGASRRLSVIDAHVRWIHEHLLQAQPAAVLDIGCGPGLYAVRLARLGHRVTGIDISPASVRYARETFATEQIECSFTEGDLRETDYGGPIDLVMQVYGELNTFQPVDVVRILAKSHAALSPGGRILLEVDMPEHIQSVGDAANTWRTVESGLFLNRPHLYMTELYWDQPARSATVRYITVDAESADVGIHTATQKAYLEDEFRRMLANAGFRKTESWPALSSEPQHLDAHRYVLTAVK